MIDEESVARILSGIEFHLSQLEKLVDKLPLSFTLLFIERISLLQGFVDGAKVGLKLKEKDDG